MTHPIPRLPFTVDPLIAEAKWRRRKRLLLAGLALVFTAGAIVLGVELRSRGSGSVGTAPRTDLTFTAVNGFSPAVFHLTCQSAWWRFAEAGPRACAAIAAEPRLIT